MANKPFPDIGESSTVRSSSTHGAFFGCSAFTPECRTYPVIGDRSCASPLGVEPRTYRLGGTFRRFWRCISGQKSNISLPIVLDANVQANENSFGQREDLSAFNHDVPKIFAALDF
jgi:hypothetical protein